MSSIKLFVPGRLCLLGEHSDWAGRYRVNNSKINKGYAIVTGIEEGIEAVATESNVFCIKNKDKVFESPMNEEKLLEVAQNDPYWCYAAGVAAVMKRNFNVSGINIDITNVTLPEKKGLSSSAALCVLIARAFNKVYNLHLDIIKEMDMAYQGELETPSRCGRLDQACAFGKKPILMEFNGEKIKFNELEIGGDFYFAFADLMSHKDTIKILSDLNECYPFARNESDANVQRCLGPINEENIRKAIELLKRGDAKEFGALMVKAQQDFDTLVAPACTELRAPKLHEVFNDPKVKEYCYGYKGVGSQGDGTVQFLCKDKESQLALTNYLNSELKMPAYTLTIEKTKNIKKAIIPLAGNGTRMYPATKCIKKAFLTLPDKDGLIKPVVMLILEELYKSGIREFCLVISEDEKEIYDAFFKQDISEEIAKKLSPVALEYEQLIKEIGSNITYIIQKDKLGLGHAVSCAKDFAGDDNVLLVLGDQIYETTNENTVTSQLLEYYKKAHRAVIAVAKTPLDDVCRYGILSGSIDQNNNYFNVDKIYEKPEPSYASEYLYTLNNGKKEYYSVFGEYVLTKKVFELLDRNIKEGRKENGEYQITSVLDEVRETEGLDAFIPDGEMLDVGNPSAYEKAFVKKIEYKYKVNK